MSTSPRTRPPTPTPASESEPETPTSAYTPRTGFLRRHLGRFVPDQVWYNWCWDAIAGVSSGIYQGCVWTFALQLARGQLFATEAQMGWASAAPAIGYLFATLWARQMEGRSKLPFVTVTWYFSRGLFLLTPLLVQGRWGREMFILLLCLAPILFSVSTPAYTAIMKEIYPDEHRGRLMSYVRVGMAGAMLVSARVMGWWQEQGGLDFRWMFAIGGVFGIGTAYAFSRLRLAPVTLGTPPPPVREFLRQAFGVLLHNPGYRWFTASVFITGFGNIMAWTLFPIYQVDRFHITPQQIATMQNIGNLLSLISLFFWGWFTDRYGSLTSVMVAVLFNCVAPLAYVFAPRVEWLYIAAASNGIAQPGIDLGYLNTTLMFAGPGQAAQYQAVHSTFFGLRGTIAPLVAVHLLPWMGYRWAPAFFFCLGVMVIGVLFQVFSLRSYRQTQTQEIRMEAKR